AATLLLQQGTTSGQAPTERDETGVAFGAKIIDIALTLDEAGKQSLAASPETGVPGKMSFTDHGGARKTYDVKVRIKGQKGSKRPIDDKPAFKIKLAPGDRFFGL